MSTDRRRLLLGLATSLFLNVFLLGVLVGHGIVQRRERLPPAGVPPIAAPRAIEGLPEDQRAKFQAAMGSHHPAIRAARGVHRDLRARAEADIAAPTFDRAVVASDLAALHQSNRAVEDATGSALLDALAGLSPASRAALVGRKPETPKP